MIFDKIMFVFNTKCIYMKKLKYLPHFHKTLSLPARLKNVRKQFDKIPQNKVEGSVKLPEISLSDVLLSGLSIFNFKFPSLLQYDKQRNEPKIKANLTPLFGIKQTICDTQMRVRLDDVAPHLLRASSTEIHKIPAVPVWNKSQFLIE